MKNQTSQTIPDTAGVVIFPPILFSGTLAAALLLSYLLPASVVPVQVALWSGAALFVVAFAMLRLAAQALRNHKTSINPKGATTTLVKTGIYRYTRNPIYLSFTLIYIAVLVMAHAWWGLLLLIPLLVVVQKGIIEREEQYLSRKFGEEYQNYQRNVRRWL